MEIVSAKLCKMFGPAKGQTIIDEGLAQLGKSGFDTPDDMKQFAEVLIGRGGLAKMIGHTLVMEALLRGAK
jgi:hypothetical protein